MMQNTLFRPSVVRESRQNFNPEGFDLAAVLKARKAAEAAGDEPVEAEEFKDLDCIPGYKTPEFFATPISSNNWSQNYRAGLAAATFPAARLSQPVQLYMDEVGESVDLVIRAAYRQVFGNAHLMDNQRSSVAESNLRNGQLTVRDFIRELAKSDAYRALFFECCSNIRAIELNFKHLLGRAPDSFQEVSAHIALLAGGGFEAEIDSYLNSTEYLENFGSDTVPYYVSYATQIGKSGAGYNRIFKLVNGLSSSDKSVASTITSSRRSQLQKSLLV